MKNAFLATILATPLFCSYAIADMTFGVGVGSLYNGLGFNFGRSSETSLMVASLGCMGASKTESTRTNGDVVTRDSKRETNCGFGLGYISTSLLPGDKHGFGLSLGYTHNTDDLWRGSEYHVMPSYHYFFNGIGNRGLNLGVAARKTFTEQYSDRGALTLNIGY